LAAVLVFGCAGSAKPEGDLDAASTEPLRRASSLERFVVAYELSPGCKLEMAPAGERPADGSWKPIESTALVKGVYQVKDRRSGKTPAGVELALRVVDNVGTEAWLRNTPAADAGEAAVRWRCAVDAAFVSANLPKLSAKVVRLEPSAPGCNRLQPILGTAEQLTFAPYVAVGVGVFAGRVPTHDEASRGQQGAIEVGVTLESAGGNKRWTVAAAQLDRCFVAADGPPPTEPDVKAVSAWLGGADPDVAPPPPAPGEALAAITGVPLARCLRDGAGPTLEHDCREPAFTVAAVTGDGQFPGDALELRRTRVVDAARVVGGKLVAPAELLEVRYAVRIPGLRERAVLEAVRLSAEDPRREAFRRSNGYKLERPFERSTGPAKPASAEVQVTARAGELETVTEKVTRTYADKKQVSNPAHTKAERSLHAARAELARATLDAPLAALGRAGVDKACDGADAKFAAVCPALTSRSAPDLGARRLAAANARVQQAEADLAKVAAKIEANDENTVATEAKVIRRKGEATVKVTLSGNGEPFTTTMTMPVVAADSELPEDAEHKLPAKAAKPPTADDYDKAVARAVVHAIDAAILESRLARAVKGDVGNALPGTRARLAYIARRAASDRPVKLVSDALETRADVLALRRIVYAVKLPPDAKDRCWIFAATPIDETVDLNLELGPLPSGGAASFVARDRDARPAAHAAILVCGLAAGEHALSMTTSGSRAGAGFLVGLFDATPDAVSADEARATWKGAPTPVPQGASVVLGAK
jgi:hypothetical protein